MSDLRGQCGAWLELARLSNLPTVLTNVLAGAAIATGNRALPWPAITTAMIAIAALYAAGMILNDVADADHDSRVRPERPIPSGRVSRRAGAIGAAALMILALLALGRQGTAALIAGALLAGFIVVYDLLHRARPWTVLFMGMCRGCVYWVAAACVDWPTDLAPLLIVSGVVAVYTVSLTVVARSENENALDLRRILAYAIPVWVLAPLILLQESRWAATLAAGTVMTLWMVLAARKVTRQLPDTRGAVLMWLSGFCLVDAFVLAAIGRAELAAAAAACLIATVIGHRRIAGT